MILFMLFTLTGCTVTGAILGAVIDKITGEDKYAAQYAAEGLEADIYILTDKKIEIESREPEEESKEKHKEK